MLARFLRRERLSAIIAMNSDLQMAGVFSQLELAMIRARVKSGMAKAKAKGSAIGRPQTTKDDIPTLFLKHYPAYKISSLI